MTFTPEYIINSIDNPDMLTIVYDKVNRNMASIYVDLGELESNLPAIPDTVDGGFVEE